MPTGTLLITQHWPGQSQSCDGHRSLGVSSSEAGASSLIAEQQERTGVASCSTAQHKGASACEASPAQQHDPPDPAYAYAGESSPQMSRAVRNQDWRARRIIPFLCIGQPAPGLPQLFGRIGFKRQSRQEKERTLSLKHQTKSYQIVFQRAVHIIGGHSCYRRLSSRTIDQITLFLG